MKLMKHEPLRPDELPKPGTLVAIDAEFVSMQQVRLLSFSQLSRVEYTTGGDGISIRWY